MWIILEPNALEKQIKQVTVTYHDNEKKVFTGEDWKIFGEKVELIAKEIDIDYE